MIRLTDVAKIYGAEDTLTVLRGINLEIRENEFLGILGSSGSGKSTLLHIMGLLDRPNTGTVLFNGNDTSGLSDEDLQLS